MGCASSTDAADTAAATAPRAVGTHTSHRQPHHAIGGSCCCGHVGDTVVEPAPESSFVKPQRDDATPCDEDVHPALRNAELELHGPATAPSEVSTQRRELEKDAQPSARHTYAAGADGRSTTSAASTDPPESLPSEHESYGVACSEKGPVARAFAEKRLVLSARLRHGINGSVDQFAPGTPLPAITLASANAVRDWLASYPPPTPPAICRTPDQHRTAMPQDVPDVHVSAAASSNPVAAEQCPQSSPTGSAAEVANAPARPPPGEKDEAMSAVDAASRHEAAAPTTTPSPPDAELVGADDQPGATPTASDDADAAAHTPSTSHGDDGSVSPISPSSRSVAEPAQSAARSTTSRCAAKASDLGAPEAPVVPAVASRRRQQHQQGIVELEGDLSPEEAAACPEQQPSGAHRRHFGGVPRLDEGALQRHALLTAMIAVPPVGGGPS